MEPIWSKLFANALKDKDVRDILTAVAASSPQAGGEAAERSREVDCYGRDCYDRMEKKRDDDDRDWSECEGGFGLFD